MAHLPVARQHPTRRSVLKSAALGSVAAVASPHVKGTYAAGTLTFGAVGCGSSLRASRAALNWARN